MCGYICKYTNVIYHTCIVFAYVKQFTYICIGNRNVRFT